MGIFNQRQQQPGQMNQQQMQTMARQELEDFGRNLDVNIEKSGMYIPQNLRGDLPSMCRYLINSGKVPAERMRFAQPLIDRLMGRR